MSITRFHPPFYPDTREHMPMDKSGRGTFVLYKDHETRINILQAKIDAREALIEALIGKIAEMSAVGD